MLSQFINYVRWPMLTGVLAALVWLQLFPNHTPHWSSKPFSSSTPLTSKAVASYAEAVKHASPAVVNIFTRKRVNRMNNRLITDPFFRHFYNSADILRQERMQSALGSGVIMDERGYLLTNHHVIAEADEIVVQLQDGREGKAEVVGIDAENDLAVLKIALDHLTAIELGTPQDAQVGDVVLAIGNPFGMGQTVTQGIISATGRYGLGISSLENFIQTDAAINPGNSGGALIDVSGKLVGINTALLDRIGNSDLNGVGLAVPADSAMRSLLDIVEYGRVVRGWLGVDAQALTPSLARSFQLESSNGVLVTRIYSNGPAHHAGLQPGDVITKIQGEPVGDGARGRRQIAESKPGDSLTIEYVRNGQAASVNVVLAQPPSNN
jgi:serine protease DegS